QVAHRGAVGEARPDESAERGVVAGAPADHEGDGAGLRRGCAHDAAGDRAHVASVGGDEAGNELVTEVRGVVEQAGHVTPSGSPRAVCHEGTLRVVSRSAGRGLASARQLGWVLARACNATASRTGTRGRDTLRFVNSGYSCNLSNRGVRN